jgi:hypothetical protein
VFFHDTQRDNAGSGRDCAAVSSSYWHDSPFSCSIPAAGRKTRKIKINASAMNPVFKVVRFSISIPPCGHGFLASARETCFHSSFHSHNQNKLSNPAGANPFDIACQQA